MSKVDFLDDRIIKLFLQITSFITTAVSFIVIFFDIPSACKPWAALAFLVVLAFSYIGIWVWSNRLNSININIEGSNVIVKVGDIFQQDGLKVIAFNEYFDTQVDNKIISENSLNGIFIKTHLGVSVQNLDSHIENYDFKDDEYIEENSSRQLGKKKKYRPGTI